MSTAATTDAPTETDIRAKILQPISAAHSLSRLLGGSTAWHCSSRQDLLVGVRELRRAIRFSDELNVAFFCRSSGGGNGWTLRVYSVTSERFADLVCCRGGIRRWQRLDSAVRFLKTNCPTVKDFTVRLLD